MNFRGPVVIGWFYANDGGCERMVAVFYGDKHGHGTWLANTAAKVSIITAGMCAWSAQSNLAGPPREPL